VTDVLDDVVVHAAVPTGDGWIDVGLSPELPCVCGHALESHQTGMGPYTGWCGSDCECEWPRYAVADRVALDHKLPADRVRALVRAQRDEDGWPIGHGMSEIEGSAVQAYDELLQEESIDPA
jgi:hypothetical protein